jgi:NADPH-dependent ferric siderophore reductase
LWRVPVTATRAVAPRLRRITLAADSLRGFAWAGSDSHVMLYFYPKGIAPPDPLTPATARAGFANVRPAMRSYTVRRFDSAAGELDIDFVLHDNAGPAAAWAAAAAPGDRLILVGPSPAYEPDPDASEYVLIGDESALPAIEVILSELDARARALVFCEVADPGEEVALHTAAALELRWRHRGKQDYGARLVAAVRGAGAEIRAGADVWIAAERGSVTALRSYLLRELGLPRERVRSSTYWRL